jgi:hypothetical protein
LFADDRCGVAFDHPCGPFVFRDPEQLGVFRKDRVCEIREALTRHDMIDPDVPEIGEAFSTLRVHDPVVLRRRHGRGSRQESMRQPMNRQSRHRAQNPERFSALVPP